MGELVYKLLVGKYGENQLGTSIYETILFICFQAI